MAAPVRFSANPLFDPADAPDPDLVYANYLKTFSMSGVEPLLRQRAIGLLQEWTEVLSGRAEPTEPLAPRAWAAGDVEHYADVTCRNFLHLIAKMQVFAAIPYATRINCYDLTMC